MASRLQISSNPFDFEFVDDVRGKSEIFCYCQLSERFSIFFCIARKIKNEIYFILESLSCLPIQFRKPNEKGQTRMSLLNSPLTTNRSGLNISGSGKIFGLCITEVSDA